MAKKKAPKATEKPKTKPEKEKEDDLFEEEISRGDEDDDEEDFYPFDDEAPLEEEEEEIAESDDDYVTVRRTASNPCIRNGYCTKCEGDIDNPEGSCNCRCHDLG